MYAAFFNCTPVDRASLYDGPDLKLFILVGSDHRGSTDDLLLLQISSGVVWQTRDLHLSCKTSYLLSHRLCLFIVSKLDLFVSRDNSLTS